MKKNTSIVVITLNKSTVLKSTEPELPTICGIPIEGYYDREISYNDLVSMAANDSVDSTLRTHYNQVIENVKNTLITFNCGMERIIILQNPTTCKIRIWFD